MKTLYKDSILRGMKYFAILLFSGILILPTGCATTTKVPKETKHLSFLPLTVEAYEWPDGIKPLRKKEWELVIINNIQTVFDEKFSSEGARYKSIQETSLSEKQKENLKETLAQWLWLMKGNISQQQPSFITPGRTDYNLGEEVAQLDPEADFLLLVFATQVLSTSDRKGRRAGANSMRFLGEMTLGILTLGGYKGGAVRYEQGGWTAMIVGLVDAKTGQVIWHEGIRDEEMDLRDSEEIKERLFHLFRTFPWNKYQFK